MKGLIRIYHSKAVSYAIKESSFFCLKDSKTSVSFFLLLIVNCLGWRKLRISVRRMDFNKVLVFFVLVGVALCADNTTSTDNNSTVTTTTTTVVDAKTTSNITTTAAVEDTNTTTTTVPPTNSTTTTTIAPSTTNTTTTIVVNVNTTQEIKTTASTTTTTTTTTKKVVKCDDPACPPYSSCNVKTNKCLMKCPNATVALTNSSSKVCGSDGVTYESLVDLKEKSCLKGVKVIMESMGECEEEKEGTNYVIIIVVLVLVLVVVIGVTAYWLYSRRTSKSKDLKDGDKSGDNLL